MGILSDQYEGRFVIGLSGHKSENTIKQYARKLSAKKKREMCGTLANNVVPKQAKMDNKFTFKSTKAVETVSKPLQDLPIQDLQIPVQNDPVIQPQNIDFVIENMPEEPSDDALIQFLATLEKVQEGHSDIAANNQLVVPEQPTIAAPLAPAVQPNQMQKAVNNTMNIQNVQNVNQHPVPNQFLPGMYFPNSTVTINYHFAK